MATARPAGRIYLQVDWSPLPLGYEQQVAAAAAAANMSTTNFERAPSRDELLARRRRCSRPASGLAMLVWAVLCCATPVAVAFVSPKARVARLSALGKSNPMGKQPGVTSHRFRLATTTASRHSSSSSSRTTGNSRRYVGGARVRCSRWSHIACYWVYYRPPLASGRVAGAVVAAS